MTDRVVQYEKEVQATQLVQERQVMPLIGPMLDAWEALPNDIRCDPDLAQFAKHIAKIDNAMGVDLSADK